MNEQQDNFILDPDTRILRAVAELDIMDSFSKYEGINIKRLGENEVKATFQEQFGEGSVTGNSVLNVLLNAVRRQKTNEYWRGYAAAKDREQQDLTEQFTRIEEKVDALTDSMEQLKAVETAIQLLAGNIINLRTELLVIKSIVAKGEQKQ